MKKHTSIICLLLIVLIYKAQEPARKLEFGATLLTVNQFAPSPYYMDGYKNIEYLNGLFFRYHYNRWAFRGYMSYLENAYSYETPPYIIDGFSGDVNNKDFKIGIGIQYSLLKKKDWLYTYFDMGYRNIFTKGHYYGGFIGANDRYTKNSNGIDNFLGIGLKLRTFKNVYLSPEFGINSSSLIIKQNTFSLRNGKSSQFSYFDVTMNLALKLRLTVKF